MIVTKEQKIICKKEGVQFLTPLSNEKIGIALSTLGKTPINGIRHPIENGTCGWCIWCGEEFFQEQDFFKPLHVEHINEYLPIVEKYLALPVGFRFLIADGYEDIWEDKSYKN